MLFPVNISKKLRERGKSTVGQRMGALFFVILLIDGGIIAYMSPLLENVGIPMWATILIVLLITALIGWGIVRHFVIREDDKYEEYSASKSASLANYFYIRNKTDLEKIDSVPIHEYTDGNFAILLSITYGTNSEVGNRENKLFFTEVFKRILKQGLSVRTYNIPEDFSDSDEYKTYMSKVSKCDDIKLKNFMVDLLDYDIKINKARSELLNTILLIRTQNPYQIEFLDTVIRGILKSFREYNTSIRGLKFLDSEQMRKFMRDYYCVEALDLTNLKSSEVSSDSLLEYKNVIKVYEVVTQDGKVMKKYDLKIRNGVEKVR